MRLFPSAVLAANLLLGAGCGSIDNYKQQKIGVIKDANVVPTSFNEEIKTQVKTDRQFFVVGGLPQLNIGQELVAKVDGSRIVEIQDANGRWYRVR